MYPLQCIASWTHTSIQGRYPHLFRRVVKTGKPFIPQINPQVKSTFAGPKLASTLYMFLKELGWCFQIRVVAGICILQLESIASIFMIGTFYTTYASGPSRSSEKWSVYCTPIRIQLFVPILFVTDICYCHRQFEYRIVHKSMFIYGFRLCCLCLCLRFVHTNISYTLFSLCAYEHIVYFVFPYIYIHIYLLNLKNIK